MRSEPAPFVGCPARVNNVTGSPLSPLPSSCASGTPRVAWQPESYRSCGEVRPGAAAAKQPAPRPSDDSPADRRDSEADGRGAGTPLRVESEGGDVVAVRSIDDTPVIIGGRSLQDARTRLHGGAEVITPGESAAIRTAFRRFKSTEASEVCRENLDGVLRHLGYFDVQCQVVHEIAAEVSPYTTFNFEEVCTVAERFVTRHERRATQAVFEDLAVEVEVGGEASLRLAAQHLPKALRRLGVPALRASCAAALAAARLGGQPQSSPRGGMTRPGLGLGEFLDFLASWSSSEGFDADEVALLREVFVGSAGAGAQDQLPWRRLPAALAQGLGGAAAATPQTCEEARAIARELLAAGGGEEDDGLAFIDFVACERRLRATLLGAMMQRFDAVDGDGDGFVDLEDLVKLLPGLCGLTLVQGAAPEFLAEVLRSSGRPDEAQANRSSLDFDGFLSFITACRASDGFTTSELKELEGVFRHFDYDNSSEIDTVELLDMFRFLGHYTSLETVHGLVRVVDRNASGGLDFKEFRRLMRLHRELEIQVSREIFESRCTPSSPSMLPSSSELGLGGDLPDGGVRAADGAISAAEMPELLARFGWGECASDVDTVVLESVASPNLRFDDFLLVAGRCRQLFAAKRRRSAGFDDDEVKQLQVLVRQCGAASLEYDNISFSVLERLLATLGVPLRTAEDRRDMLDLLHDARRETVEAGVDIALVQARADESMSFPVLLQLLRCLIRRAERETLTREVRAMEDTGFSHADISGFREVFMSMLEFGTVRFEEESTPVRRRGHSRHPSDASPANSLDGSLGLFGFGMPPSPSGGASPVVLPAVDAMPSLAQLFFERPRGSGLSWLRATLTGERDCNGVGAHLTLPHILELLRTLGLRPTQEQRQTLAQTVRSLAKPTTSAQHASGSMSASESQASDDAASRAGSDSDSQKTIPALVDFAAFLRLMHWMTDANFARVNEAAAKILSASSEASRSSPLAGSGGGPSGEGSAPSALVVAATAAVTPSGNRHPAGLGAGRRAVPP